MWTERFVPTPVVLVFSVTERPSRVVTVTLTGYVAANGWPAPGW